MLTLLREELNNAARHSQPDEAEGAGSFPSWPSSARTWLLFPSSVLGTRHRRAHGLTSKQTEWLTAQPSVLRDSYETASASRCIARPPREGVCLALQTQDLLSYGFILFLSFLVVWHLA